jgi:hypothetical protein
MDSLTSQEVANLKDLDGYNARTEIGDIIVVKPDGWKWGAEERLPTFIVVKAPQIDLAAAENYAEPLRAPWMILGELRSIVVRRRKYRIPPALIQAAITQGISQITLTAAVVSANLITKVS